MFGKAEAGGSGNSVTTDIRKENSMRVPITEEVLQGQGCAVVHIVNTCGDDPMDCCVTLRLPFFVYEQMRIPGLIQDHGGQLFGEFITKDAAGNEVPHIYEPIVFRTDPGHPELSPEDGMSIRALMTLRVKDTIWQYQQLRNKGVNRELASALTLTGTKIGFCTFSYKLLHYKPYGTSHLYILEKEPKISYEHAEYVKAIDRAVQKALCKDS
jgi:hypothetical protein